MHIIIISSSRESHPFWAADTPNCLNLGFHSALCGAAWPHTASWKIPVSFMEEFYGANHLQMVNFTHFYMIDDLNDDADLSETDFHDFHDLHWCTLWSFEHDLGDITQLQHIFHGLGRYGKDCMIKIQKQDPKSRIPCKLLLNLTQCYLEPGMTRIHQK